MQSFASRLCGRRIVRKSCDSRQIVKKEINNINVARISRIRNCGDDGVNYSSPAAWGGDCEIEGGSSSRIHDVQNSPLHPLSSNIIHLVRKNPTRGMVGTAASSSWEDSKSNNRNKMNFNNGSFSFLDSSSRKVCKIPIAKLSSGRGVGHREGQIHSEQSNNSIHEKKEEEEDRNKGRNMLNAALTAAVDAVKKIAAEEKEKREYKTQVEAEEQILKQKLEENSNAEETEREKCTKELLYRLAPGVIGLKGSLAKLQPTPDNLVFLSDLVTHLEEEVRRRVGEGFFVIFPSLKSANANNEQDKDEEFDEEEEVANLPLLRYDRQADLQQHEEQLRKRREEQQVKKALEAAEEEEEEKDMTTATSTTSSTASAASSPLYAATETMISRAERRRRRRLGREVTSSHAIPDILQMLELGAFLRLLHRVMHLAAEEDNLSLALRVFPLIGRCSEAEGKRLGGSEAAVTLLSGIVARRDWRQARALLDRWFSMGMELRPRSYAPVVKYAAQSFAFEDALDIVRCCAALDMHLAEEALLAVVEATALPDAPPGSQRFGFEIFRDMELQYSQFSQEDMKIIRTFFESLPAKPKKTPEEEEAERIYARNAALVRASNKSDQNSKGSKPDSSSSSSSSITSNYDLMTQSSWQVQSVKMPRNGVCPCCNTTLRQSTLPTDIRQRLISHLESCLADPRGVKEFRAFVNRFPKVDAVLDGMNIGYYAGRSFKGSLIFENVLVNQMVKEYQSKGKTVVVILKRHAFKEGEIQQNNFNNGNGNGKKSVPSGSGSSSSNNNNNQQQRRNNNNPSGFSSSGVLNGRRASDVNRRGVCGSAEDSSSSLEQSDIDGNNQYQHVSNNEEEQHQQQQSTSPRRNNNNKGGNRHNNAPFSATNSENIGKTWKNPSSPPSHSSSSMDDRQSFSSRRRPMRSAPPMFHPLTFTVEQADDTACMLGALLCGGETEVVTNDEYGDHVLGMAEDLIPHFRRWKQSHLVPFSFENYNPSITPRRAVEISVQCNVQGPSSSSSRGKEEKNNNDLVVEGEKGLCWHFPPQHLDDEWLCIKQVAGPNMTARK